MSNEQLFDTGLEVNTLRCAGIQQSTMTNQPTREEHLQWCKQRAIQYCDAGDTNQAFASMASDMSNHPETSDHIALGLGMVMMIGGNLKSPTAMRKFIEGFN